MNREQRRKNGVKVKDPTIVLKRSEFVNFLQNDVEMQKALQNEVKRLEAIEVKKQSENIDALILHSLHEVFGFGKKRLLQFVDGFILLKKYYLDRYEDDDIFAIKEYLKNTLDIDIEKIEEEVEHAIQDSD